MELITVFQYLKDSYREDGDTLVMMMHGNRRKENEHKLLQGKFSLYIRKSSSQ